MAHIPLFQKNLLLRTLGEVTPLPEEHLQILKKWQASLQSGSLNKIKEISLHGQFLTDIFGQILGYHGITDGHGESWEWQAEVSIPTAGLADAALGFLSNEENHITAPIELKGAMTSLDHPMSRGYTPVQQAWRYGNAVSGCKWVIVSNYRELRLYATDRTPAEYELFEITKLTEPTEYARFQLLLGRDQFLSEEGASDTDRLLAESGAAEKAITRQLYADYRGIRMDLFKQFVQSNPETTETTLISLAQKILDRVLFVAFAEDVGLLPHNILLKAYETSNAFVNAPIWDNFKGLFHAVDVGNASLSIPRYNGGLFAPDTLLDTLNVPDEACEHFKRLAEYDFSSEVSVSVLGHIFEQSITDLEEMRDSTGSPSAIGKRKKDGVFYTPDAITRYIVEETMGGYLRQKFEALQAAQTGRSCKKKEIIFWETYREEVLKPLKVCDPACGSGAFLVAAFDYLNAEYRRVNDALHDLTGSYSLFDLDKTILTNNLFGVDINPESVEISKLSLWLKTAEKGKPLTSLDANILCGNSLINDDFNWKTQFSEVFDAETSGGGFDIVLGNPPYVRQELIKHLKPQLEEYYAVYHGVADLYAYFFERGLSLLKENGRLGYIASSTFFKTGAGKPLREFIRANASVETIVDFGDMQVFEGATTYPAILVMERVKEPQTQPQRHEDTKGNKLAFINALEVTQDNDLGAVLTAEPQQTTQAALKSDGWKLESAELGLLREKLMHTGKPLKEVCGSPLYGIKTGLNDAFVINQTTYDHISAQNAANSELLKPFLEGKDLKPWHVESRKLWLIRIPKGWTQKQSGHAQEDDAWLWMQQHYAAICEWLEPFADKARKRGDKGEFWWELRACSYYEAFESSKIVYSHFSTRQNFTFDQQGFYNNDKGYIIPCKDRFLLGLLMSKVEWFLMRAMAPAVRGGFHELRAQYIEQLPIPNASKDEQQTIATLAENIQTLAENRYTIEAAMQHRIASDLGGSKDAKLSKKLRSWWLLEFVLFHKEVKKCFKTDIPLSERTNWEEFLTTEANKITIISQQIKQKEAELNRLVYALFKLTDKEIVLLEGSLYGF
ncbi:MAG: N-6 DNA methylase [Mariprofundaceae bacterium]